MKDCKVAKVIDIAMDMEKKVMIRLCAKIVAETDLYETDKEVQNLIDWVLGNIRR